MATNALLFRPLNPMRSLTDLSKHCTLSLSVALSSTLMISGCVAPDYSYGYPYGAPVPTTPPQQVQVGSVVQPEVQQVPAPGVVVASGYPSPYLYAPAPALIAPTFYFGYGNGYWYGNRFWPYRTGCAFYGGRYYGGYRTNYWHRGYGGWQGGNYHGGNQNWQGNRGGYGGTWNR